MVSAIGRSDYNGKEDVKCGGRQLHFDVEAAVQRAAGYVVDNTDDFKPIDEQDMNTGNLNRDHDV